MKQMVPYRDHMEIPWNATTMGRDPNSGIVKH